MPMRLVTALCLAIFTGLIQAQTLSPNPVKLYAVIFDVTVTSAGVVENLAIAKVIDPSSGTTNAVEVAVPDRYVSAARAFLRKRNYGTESAHFNTWLFYDPNRPDRADIDPESGRP
jgi:hypothetical protein